MKGWLQNRSGVWLAKIASTAFRSASIRGSSSAGGSANFGATVIRRAGNVRAAMVIAIRPLERAAVGKPGDDVERLRSGGSANVDRSEALPPAGLT